MNNLIGTAVSVQIYSIPKNIFFHYKIFHFNQIFFNNIVQT